MLPLARTSSVRFGDFAFDRGTRLLRRGDQEIPLPPRVLAVLDLLLDRAGEVVPRQAIIDSVWKDAFVTDTSLAEAVSFLRQALGDDPQAPAYIQTVHRRGYRFVAPIVDSAGPAAAAGAPAADEIVKPSIFGDLVPWAVATFCALAAVVAVWQLTHRDVPVPPVVRLRIDPPPGISLDTRAPAVAIAPDGDRAVFVACGDVRGDVRCDLYARDIDRLDEVKVAGTYDASAPFFSPDGRWVGFFSEGKLKKIALSGGSPIVLADAPQTFGAAWLPDHAIVFAGSRFAGLKRVSDSGGPATPLTEPTDGDLGHAWPAVLPDGRAIVFTASSSPLGRGPVRVAPYEPGAAQGVRPSQVVLGPADRAVPVGRDYLAYSRRDDLYAVPFDRARLATAGNEQQTGLLVIPLQFAVSSTGALLHLSSMMRPGQDSSIWALGSSAERPILGIGRARAATLSPDGHRVAVVSDDDDTSDIWVMELDRGTTTRLTHGGVNVAPVWSGDGSAVYYGARTAARFEVWRRDAGATAAPVRVAARPDAHLFPTSASAGMLIVTVANRGANISMLPANGGPESTIVGGAYDDVAGALSPDGTLLAYQSDESGRWEIYLLRLSDKHRTPISAGGGVAPFWSADGSALYYSSGARLMRAVIVAGEPGTAALAAPLPALSRPIGVGPDGIVRLTRDNIPQPGGAVLTLEWLRELRQLLGPPGPVLPR